MQHAIALPPRVAAKIDADRVTGCWNWTAAKDKLGYGRVRWEGRTVFSHRLVMDLLGHAIDGLVIDHLCRNTSCCNPDHLEAVPQGVNVGRGDGPRLMSERWAVPRHCPQGHQLWGDNLYEHYSPRLRRVNRQCRTCRAANDKKRKALKKQGRAA